MLKIKQLSLKLSDRPVLQQISLQMASGLNVIVGPNGSGKTSLLRCIAGLLPVEQGEVLWRGESLSATPVQERAKLLSYLAQNPPVHWPITARALVELGRLNPRESQQQADQAIDRAMGLCLVSQFADRRMDQLSGGERARVLLARALAVEADLLLVDEPNAALDPAQQLAMMQILANQGKAGKTVLCVLHDLPLASRFADHLIVLQGGRLVVEGKPETVLPGPELRAAFGLAFDAKGHFV
ncbi:MAG: ABC transporter [Robiginitomaculum sp.]|nr:MAG: ABC transporter [Robiginitomaculum sp.]